ncbi:hypothetical protein DFP97_10652 [Paenibacillus prosopidis]|uniref:AP2-like integrase N-terminal domain-containing protein n=1 Tax=Paenibacillus prosopidis TaxID=630520 RepID=A0A368W0J7_9BACL|nr:hypothetical protein DFP97_10652 [Paenibacillus prosopidis]
MDNRNKDKPDKKPNWEDRFEGAKVDGKRKHITKAGFRTKKEVLEAGTKALAEYNNAGLVFTPSEVSVADYLNYWFEQYVKPIECIAKIELIDILGFSIIRHARGFITNAVVKPIKVAAPIHS